MPNVEPLRGPFGTALTVDVEEWYHNCFMPEYLDPETRPELLEELDWILPEVMQLLSDRSVKATFFVLGELAGRLKPRLRELVESGHELASHGFAHFRVSELSRRDFAADLSHSKTVLEQTAGVAVVGYRAPEWSLRSVHNPYLESVREAGYLYDSSLAPCWGVGRKENPRQVSRLVFSSNDSLIEVPPTALFGSLRIPASGWLGRLGAPRVVARAMTRHRSKGGLAMLNVHPWELVDRPLPGVLRGMGRWAHETGRKGFRAKFSLLLEEQSLGWQSIVSALGKSSEALGESTLTRARDERPVGLGSALVADSSAP